MLKIEAIVQPFKIDDIKTALARLGIERVMFSDVLEHGDATAPKTYYRGAEYHVGAHMVKMEVLISSLQAEEVIQAVSRAARTGNPGDDGTILVSEITDAIRVRNGQRVSIGLS